MRQIVLDTETTGTEAARGDRVIEIGCWELLDRRPTGPRRLTSLRPLPGSLTLPGPIVAGVSTRPFRLVVLAVLLAPLLAGACAEADDACRGAVIGSISYYGSSVPPPYHVEWTITVDGDRGRFEVTPGYGAVQRWSADFVVDHTLAAAACTALAAAEEVGEAESVEAAP